MHPTTLRLATALCLLPAWAAAHELGVSFTLAAPAVTIRAAYGGQEPVPFAQVAVYSPAQPATPYYSGVADQRGYFSFVPNRGGDWRVLVDDEEGHRREITIAVPQPFEAQAGAAASPPPPSRLERLLLGLAILFGLTGFVYGFKARRRS